MFPKVEEVFHDLRKKVTLEPVVALYMLSFGLDIVMRPSLLLQKSCIFTHEYSYEVCENITNGTFESELNQVQKTVTEYERNLMLASLPMRVLYCLLGGYWMDKNGRKYAFLLPVAGRLLANVTYILNYAYLESAAFGWMYSEFVNELCGNHILYYLAQCSYMADITKPDERTSRMAFVDGTDYIFSMIGAAISSVLFFAIGYYGVFGIAAGCALLGLVYGISFMKESLPSEAKQLETKESFDKKEKSSFSRVWSALTASFKEVAKPRENNRRRMILFLVFNFAFIAIAYYGTEGSHRYLYTQVKYGWDEADFSLYYSVYRIMYLITLWILIPITSSYFKVCDATLAIGGSISGAMGMMIPAIVTPAWGMYLGCIVACFVPAGTMTVRSMASKCVNDNEIGRVFSVISLMNAVGSTAIAAAYQAIYAATVDYYAGDILHIKFLFLYTHNSRQFLSKKKTGFLVQFPFKSNLKQVNPVYTCYQSPSDHHNITIKR